MSCRKLILDIVYQDEYIIKLGKVEWYLALVTSYTCFVTYLVLALLCLLQLCGRERNYKVLPMSILNAAIFAYQIILKLVFPFEINFGRENKEKRLLYW